MTRVTNFGWWHHVLLSRRRDHRTFQTDRLIDSRTNYSAYGYESPRLMVIGSVRKFSTGSSSSGKADANSQYYW